MTIRTSQLLLASFASVAMFALGACGDVVDCGALCDRTLACEVTFVAPDDPDAQMVADETRTEEASCVLGCEAHPVVNVDTAACVDELDTRDPSVCQEQVLSCFELAQPG